MTDCAMDHYTSLFLDLWRMLGQPPVLGAPVHLFCRVASSSPLSPTLPSLRSQPSSPPEGGGFRHWLSGVWKTAADREGHI